MNYGKNFILYYAKAWEAKYKRPYRITWGRDGALAKRLIDSYGFDESKRICDYYFSSFRNKLALDSSHSLNLLVYFSNQLAAEMATKSDKEAKSHEDYELIAAARSKLGDEK